LVIAATRFLMKRGYSSGRREILRCQWLSSSSNKRYVVIDPFAGSCNTLFWD
jgi:hypothetical protein